MGFLKYKNMLLAKQLIVHAIWTDWHYLVEVCGLPDRTRNLHREINLDKTLCEAALTGTAVS